MTADNHPTAEPDLNSAGQVRFISMTNAKDVSTPHPSYRSPSRAIILLITAFPSARQTLKWRSDAVQSVPGIPLSMIRARDIFLTLLIAAAPLGGVAQAAPLSGLFAETQDAIPVLQIDGQRRDKAREQAEDGQRMSLGDIVRRVQSGREGRMLGVRPQGDTYVVRWEYPGGRIVDITVDARSGRILGER